MTMVAISSASAFAQERAPVISKEDVESLMNEGIQLAEQLLREHGEFFPYGYAMQTDGEIQSVAASDGTEHPPSQELIDLLNAGFRKNAESGKYRATALFIDVRVAPEDGAKVDAVQFGLEHRSGYCVNVYYPYTRSPDGQVQFGEIFASPRKGVVFEACR